MPHNSIEIYMHLFLQFVVCFIKSIVDFTSCVLHRPPAFLHISSIDGGRSICVCVWRHERSASIFVNILDQLCLVRGRGRVCSDRHQTWHTHLQWAITDENSVGSGICSECRLADGRLKSVCGARAARLPLEGPGGDVREARAAAAPCLCFTKP